jgi:heptosyltransferase-2
MFYNNPLSPVAWKTKMALFGKMTISSIKNLLVVLPNPMGDAILAAGALNRLRSSLPDSKITFLASPTVTAVMADNPWNNDWLTYGDSEGQYSLTSLAKNIRSSNFDAVILMPNSFRAAFVTYRAGIKIRIGYRRDNRSSLLTHPVVPFRLPGRFAPLSMLAYYGHLINSAITLFNCPAVPDNTKLELFTNEKDRQQIDELFARWQINSHDHMVILVPGGAFGPSKLWPAERFAQLADKLTTQDNCRVILSCAPNEMEQALARQITTAAQPPLFDLSQENLSLGALKELIRRCRLMVANDTGPCHIAAAFNVPLVTLFGPTDPRWTATGYGKEIRLRVDVPCGPCQQKICPPGHHRCMLQISVEDAYAAARKLLNPVVPGKTANNKISDSIFGSWYSPYDENFVPLCDGSGLVHSEYKDILTQAGLATCAEVFAYEKGSRLDKPGLAGSRERIRLELPASDDACTTLYLKRYHSPGTVQLIKRLFTRRSRAGAGCYDFAPALELAQKGISVARPIAYGQECSKLGEKRSFVIIEELPHADALERLLPRWEEAKQDYQLLGDKRELIKKVAELVRRLHEAGLFHRDLYLAHIFLGKDDTGQERLSLIDLQRIFRPLICKRRWQVKDLAQLYYSGREFFSRTDIIRFLHTYLQKELLSAQDKTLARAVYRKAQRIARHDKNRMRRFEQTTTS